MSFSDSFFFTRRMIEGSQSVRPTSASAHTSRRASPNTSWTEGNWPAAPGLPRLSNSETATALAAEHASKLHHLLYHATSALARRMRGAPWALQCARDCKKAWVSRDHRPPTSPAMTTKRALPCDPCRSRNFGLWGNEYEHYAYPNPHVSLRSALKRLHEKNWRESLPVMEFHHPPNSPWILAAIPESQNRQNTTGHPVQSWFPFYLFLEFGWLGFAQVSLIYHQQIETLALERCHCLSHLPFLEPTNRLL